MKARNATYPCTSSYSAPSLHDHDALARPPFNRSCDLHLTPLWQPLGIDHDPDFIHRLWLLSFVSRNRIWMKTSPALRLSPIALSSLPRALLCLCSSKSKPQHNVILHMPHSNQRITNIMWQIRSDFLSQAGSSAQLSSAQPLHRLRHRPSRCFSYCDICELHRTDTYIFVCELIWALRNWTDTVNTRTRKKWTERILTLCVNR